MIFQNLKFDEYLILQEYSREACTRTLDCSHVCGGIKGEMNCLPCLLGCSADATLKQDADDMCMICFSEALSAAPCLQVFPRRNNQTCIK